MHGARMVPKLARPATPSKLRSFRAGETSTHGTLPLWRPRSSTCPLLKEQETCDLDMASSLLFELEQTSAIFGKYEDMSDAHTA